MDQIIRSTYALTLPKISREQVFYFLTHLDRYYMELSPGHKAFRLTQGDKLKKGAHLHEEMDNAAQIMRSDRFLIFIAVCFLNFCSVQLGKQQS